MADTEAASLNGHAILEPSCAQYNVHTDGSVPLIEIAGELDISNADTLARCLSVFEPGDEVIIDVSHLAFIDSTGISVLAQTWKRGVRIIARGAHGEVRRALEICGLDSRILAPEDRG